MDTELTEPSKINSKTENLAVTEESNVVESITVEAKARNRMKTFLGKEIKTQAYKKAMNIDIENINTFSKRKKYIQLNSMQDDPQSYRTRFFRKSNTFPDYLKKIKE